jgi:ABC-type transport system substrate-binding protein
MYIQRTDRERDFDIRMESSVGGSVQAAESAYTKFHSTGAQNIGSINDPEMDRLSEAATREVDLNKRKELFTQMQRRIIDQMHYVSLPTIALFQAMQPWLHGFSGSYSAQISIYNSHAAWMEVDKLSEARRKF